VLEAGIGHHGVESPEALPRRLDRAPISISSGQISLVRLARAIRVGIEVDRQHPGSGALKPGSDRPTDTAGRTRHQHAAAVRVVHVTPYTLVRP